MGFPSLSVFLLGNLFVKNVIYIVNVGKLMVPVLLDSSTIFYEIPISCKLVDPESLSGLESTLVISFILVKAFKYFPQPLLKS